MKTIKSGDYHCIICEKPIGSDGVLCTIKDVSVSLCKEHSDACDQNCDSCIHANKCRVFRGGL